MKYLGAIAGSSMFIIAIVWGISVKIGVWNECRAQNSWWYCYSLISK